MLDEIFFLSTGTDTAFAAASLMAIRVGGGALDITGAADGDQHVGEGDYMFELDLLALVDDLRAAVVPVSFVDFPQLGSNVLLQLFFAAENFFQLGDVLANGL